MSAINFVVRDVAGNISRGSVAGEGVPSSLIVGAGADVSLNLTQGQIISYTRQGQALEITLVDGRVIVIEGYFTTEGVSENQLFLSSDGYLTEVDLTQGAGADYFANYSVPDSAGKFAANEDLFFMRGSDVMLADSFVPADDEVGMLGAAIGGLAPLFGWGGAAAAAGVVAVAGVGGGGDGPAAPEVAVLIGTETDEHVVNEEDHADGVTVGGTGTVGGTVDVTIQDTTVTTTVGEDGTWEVVFDPADIEPGEYETPIDVTITNEGGSTSTSDVLVVDTIIGVDVDGLGGADSVVNMEEFGDGITLSGAAGGADSVVVTIKGTDYDAVVVDGSWSLEVSTSVLGEGEYTETVTVTATDAAGNSSSTTATLEVDTLIGVTSASVGGSDGIINASEFGSGIALSGTVTGNDSVVVTIDGQPYNAVVSYNEVTNQGTWTLAVPTSVMGQGEYTQTVTVTTTDQAGNSSSATTSFEVDTLIGVTANGTGGSDGVINANEFGDGVALSGTVTGNDAVVVTINGQNYDAVVSYNEVTNQGTWTLAVPTSVMGAGEYSQNVTVTTTDQAGNSSSADMTVVVDTLIGVSGATVGGDDSVVNDAEFGNGVTLTGTVDGSDSVVVTIDGQNFTANVSYNETTNQGTWSLDVPTSVMGEGEYTKNVTITTTDDAGNSDSATVAVQVDTYVNELTTTATVAGDDVVNLSEAAQGLTLSGTVEAMSTVMITYTYPGGEIVREADVDGFGNWSITYGADEVPMGDYTANVTIAATDQYGNTDSITDTFQVDTEVPEPPAVSFVGQGDEGVSQIIVNGTGGANGNDFTVSEITANGSVQQIADESDTQFFGDAGLVDFTDSPLSDGSHLVVNETDGAGNEIATFVAIEETGTNTVDLAGLDNFDVGSIDLSFATDAELTLDLAMIEGLSDVNNNLIIHGGRDDTITLVGGADKTNQTTEIDGKTYDVYTMGDDGAQIFIEDDIQNVTF